MTAMLDRTIEDVPEVETVHNMRIADHTGDTAVTWRASNTEEVEIARAAFRAAKDKGHLAYRVGERGRESEVMRDFDPAAEHIVLMPQTVGG